MGQDGVVTDTKPGHEHRPPFEPAADLSTSGWRASLRRRPGGAQLLQVLVFAFGLLFVLFGVALIPLPGPFTIPPILFGVYLWSTEFGWAERLLERAKKSAREAWQNAKDRPLLSGLVTGSGLVALGVGIYLVSRFELIVQVLDWVV